MSDSQKFTLDRIDGDKAVLISNKDGKIVVPKKMLPKDLKEGDNIVAQFLSEENYSTEKNKKAKEILNEILS